MTILELFHRSPFKPLQQHMRTVVQCAEQVTPLFEALCEGDAAGVERVQEKIDELEKEADGLKNEIRAHLPKRLFMPVDRRDLLDVLDMQDSIADTAQDIAGLLTEREMRVQESMRRPLMELVHAVVRACVRAGQVMESLDELAETSFRGREAERVLHMIDEVVSIETETDRLGVVLSRELFRLEESMSPVSVIFWYQLCQWIGDLADYAEKASNRLRLLIAS